MSYSTYFSEKCCVKESGISGKGLFSKETIRKGELVVIKFGRLVHKNLHAEITDVVGDTFLQIDDDFFIGPTNKEEISNSFAYLNHSCEPNLGLSGQISFYAMEDIPPKTEVTFDYATSTDRSFSMECACGSSTCRKIITGNDWKIEQLQEKYGFYFSNYILRKIEKT